jgi:cation diffusion facilitator family transporter
LAAPGGSKTIVLIALGANFTIAICKFLAYLWTNSSAMLSEAIHSLVDTSNQGLILLGLHRAKRPADAQHPFGYSKELYFWSFIVAIVLFSLGAGVAAYEGVEKILHPHPLKNVHINYIVLTAAIAIEGFATYQAVKEFNRRRGNNGVMSALRMSKDPALFAIVLEDVAAMTGLFVALIGVFVADNFGIPQADGVASLAIAFVLASVALFMSREVKALLVGEAASPEVRQGLRSLLEAQTESGGPIKYINEIRTMHLGPEDILVAASVDFRDGLTANDVETTTTLLEDQVRSRFPEVRRLFVEVQSRKEYQRLVRSEPYYAETDSAEPTLAAKTVAAAVEATQNLSGDDTATTAASGDADGSRKHRKKQRKKKKK